jgi:hypothetical protein
MLVGISEAICLLFLKFSFILLVEFWSIKKDRPFHKGSYSFIQGKTKRNYSTLSLPMNTNKVGIQNPNDNCNNFNQWLAGLIEGDGCFQFNQICENYNIPVIQSSTLTYNNGWFSGFFDSDGGVYLNFKSSQMFITASQKIQYLLDPLIEL